MKIEKIAAIDIGSNASRLLFSNVIGKDENNIAFKKSSLIRVPLRLGFDAFLYKRISLERKAALLNTMIAYKHLMDAHNVKAFRACATSAMREAENGMEIIEEIKEKTGIQVDIISGQQEAEIIFENRSKILGNKDANYLFMDVGGGSTELTLFSNQKVIQSKSFNIGTIRLLKEMNVQEVYDDMKAWTKELIVNFKDIEIIGSGGNINKTHKLLNKKENKPIFVYELKNYFEFLNTFTYEDRIFKLGLNPDRADVIIPALKLYLKVSKWTNSHVIHVPKIGVADGIIQQLYRDYTK